MAQVAIREYDVKQMLHRFLKTTYHGVQIREKNDLEQLDSNKKYVIKPDMLFGKRGKRGLIGIGLSKSECIDWFEKYFQKAENIDGVDGTLDIFLAEEFHEISQEYYLSFSQRREGDSITFSDHGGIDIEENWDTVKSICLPVSQKMQASDLTKLQIKNPDFQILVTKLWDFYKSHGFVSLEFNPIAKNTQGEYNFLDAVAKIDDQEAFRQRDNWKYLEIPNSYGFKEHAGEKYIRELDGQTGASLKLKILNPEAKIWTLFAGGGGSLVMTDSLGALGYAGEIGNYGECSGNPSREFTREYTKTLLKEMLANKKDGKYLIIAGAIANFTNIKNTFQGVIDALEVFQEEILAQNVQILVRRGGINEKKGLKILADACKRLQISAKITGSDAYMTDILKEIRIS